MTLKTKSFINIVISVVLIFSLSGYLSFSYFKDILQQQIAHEKEVDAKKVKNKLINIQDKQKYAIASMQNDKKVLLILKLISNYEYKQNHESLIFVPEKKSLLEYSARYFQKDENYQIEFFDKHGKLIVAKSFKKNQKYLEEHKALCTNDKIYYKHEDKIYTLCQSKEIVKDKQRLGFIKISYYLDKQELQKLSENLFHPLSLSADAKAQQKAFILSHSSDTAYVQQKEKDFVLNMLMGIFFMIILMAFVFHLFISREILNPLLNLKIALESMLSKKYQPIKIENNDEIGQIFETSNKIFHQFWKSYSSLDGYKKSVETSNLVTETDLQGKITYANELFCTTSGYEKEEVIAKPHNIVRHPDMSKDIFVQMWKTIKKGDTWRGVVKNKTKSGGYYWTDAVISPVHSLNKEIEGYISIRRDITELLKNKDELEFRANYDLLTKLKSRDKLYEDLKTTSKPALILINIDRFSQINDFYGLEFGDLLLQKFSKIVKRELEKHISVEFDLYRFGGDEFAVLVKDYKKETVVANILEVLKHIENNSIEIQNKEVNLNISCGISFEESRDALLCADMALKISKKDQKVFEVYSDENSLNKKYENNFLWTAKLKKAIEEDRVVPFFQPIVNNLDYEQKKYEALVRIVEDDGKVISPFFFLDIAKQTKQYLEITKIMVEKSFDIFKNRTEDFSINLTMEDISNTKMKKFLLDKFDKNQDISKRLVLELVESESIEDYDEVIDFINIAKSKGCKIAIDDFGSGYSNFEYLVKLQADFIKIDGSLIKNINKQKESFVVVSTIVNFAKEMDIKTIAEFIEDEDILKTVKELGIDFSQGYHFSAPKREV
jgi:diguanylate cyclase (GGDEF)-like protein/PAS domain S-box-containing protein